MLHFLSRLPRIPVVLRLKWYRWYNPLRLRISGCTIGKRSNIINAIYLFRHPEAQISIGDDFVLTSGDGFNPLSRNLFASLCARGRGRITIGHRVRLSSVSIWAIDSITLGNDILIGADTILMDNDAHSIHFLERRSTFTGHETIASAPIVIEDDVFIGMRCLILKGVRIGRGAIVAAGSVVTHDIPPHTIVAGNPAKIVRHLSNQYLTL